MSAASTKAGKPARKRRRRQASYETASSSSDSDSVESTSSNSSSASNDKKKDERAMDVDGLDAPSDSRSSTTSASSSTSSDSSSTSSDSSSESDTDSSDSDVDDQPKRSTAANASSDPPSRPMRLRAPTLSPSPPPRAIPSFFAVDQATNTTDDRRTRFRRVYMEKLVEGFGDDLQKLRESDPTLGPSRLQLLIDSLAAGESYSNRLSKLIPGMEVFNDGQKTDGKDEGVDEVGLILGDK